VSPDGKIVMLGQQFRRISTLHRIKTTRKKVWLPGMKGRGMKRIAQKELAMGPWQYDDSVEVIYMNSFEEYDRFVKENIVIVDLWAATANNAVLEAIALNAPFFIRKLPSTAQYLGEHYPLFFSTFEELQDMIGNEDKLEALLLSGNNYLKRMDKRELSLEQFGKALQQCATTGLVEFHKRLSSAKATWLGEAEEREREVDEREHLEKNWCDDCRWRGASFSCQQRVKWEMEVNKFTEMEAKEKNLPHCGLAAWARENNWCDDCLWRNALFSCRQRVEWEMEQWGSAEIEAKRANLPHCTSPRTQQLHDAK
jgi:hypothetical protein